jgi:hypothetical protein
MRLTSTQLSSPFTYPGRVYRGCRSFCEEVTVDILARGGAGPDAPSAVLPQRSQSVIGAEGSDVIILGFLEWKQL